MLMAVEGPYALMVQPDDILISPREVDEHFGTMACFHPRYALWYVRSCRRRFVPAGTKENEKLRNSNTYQLRNVLRGKTQILIRQFKWYRNTSSAFITIFGNS